MFETTKDVLWKDECQPLTTEQMADIKSQFHPSNTANVNIVPYHIYDEDEHIVGEWRETIDGVKKKKPVYEKTIFANDISASSIVTIDSTLTVSNCSIVDIYGTFYSPENNAYMPLPQVSRAGANYQTGISISSAGVSLNVGTSEPLKQQIKVIIRYTKTTDTWEEV